MNQEERWLLWARELQALSQAGIHYSKDKFDIERFERIREISAEMISYKTDISKEKIQDLFCNETGFQTPKIDTRAAIFKDNKILLVKENNGKWSLPGGWCDVDQSIKENVIKEVKEEAGLNVIPTKLIAVQDRNKHNKPIYAYNICKFFVMCDLISGSFKKNIETTDSNFFKLDEISDLAEEKNTIEQIKMCFDAKENNDWKIFFD